jgi:hypothetical protein
MSAGRDGARGTGAGYAVAALSVSLILASGAGCGGAAPVPRDTSDAPAMAVISTEGGRVERGRGAVVLEIPPGALERPTAVTISVASDGPAGTVGTVYDFGPSGLIFDQPVKVVFSYAELALSAEERRRLSVVRSEDGRWVPLSEQTLDEAEARVTGLTMHFCRHALMLVGQ